jgi:predicted  nucleic acid-binding Zn-ribbon protein
VYPVRYTSFFLTGQSVGSWGRGSSVNQEIEHLLDLQKIDMELAELVAVNDSLPLEVAKLEEAKSETLAAVREGEGALDGMRKSKERLDHTLEERKAKLRDLLSKQIVIKTNEEYAALSREIEAARREISGIEDEILAIMESHESAAAGLDEARRASHEAARDIDSRIQAVNGELARLGDALAVKRDERLRLTKRITPTILERYERILSSKGDFALAPLTDGACSGCYMTLPPQMAIEVRRSTRLIECQSCGRILFFRPERDGG